MDKKQPLLSICIPTYNRGQYLEQALESYVKNLAFDNDVEIVISDNASSDNTEAIGLKYATKFDNIKYYRNQENLRDSNFCLALNRANGHYVKLMNDNLIITETGLGYLKEVIRKHIEDKEPIFFTNGIYAEHNSKDVHYENFDEFIVNMSFIVTAILTFGAWKEDWSKIINPTKYTKLLLNQDDWIYQIVENRGSGYICKGKYCTSIVIDKSYRKGYNWFEVHIENYYKILQPYIDKGLVTKKSIRKEKEFYLKNLKTELVINYLYNISLDFRFDLKGTTGYLWRAFKGVPLYYFMMITLPIWGGYKVLSYFINNNKQ